MLPSPPSRLEQAWVLLQIEQEGVAVKGSPHFNPDPDAETLYKAMKGIGEWVSVALPGNTAALWGSAHSAQVPSGEGMPGVTS